MIKVKHPLQHCNDMQEELISKSPDNEKSLHELLFSYGNASYRYHYNARSFAPSIVDFKEWLSGLEPNIKVDMEQRGFEGCLGVLSFTRYVNEKNDEGMDEFVKSLMGADDFEKYKKIIEGKIN